MKGKISFIMLIVFVLAMVRTTTAYGVGSTVEIIPVDNLNQLRIGDSFNVNIKIKDVSNLVGGELIISYASASVELANKELKLLDTTDFSTIEGVSNTNLTDSDGKAVFVFGLNKNISAIDGDILIGSLEFNAINKGPGSISIDAGSSLISEDASGNYDTISFTSTPLEYSVLGVGSVNGTVNDNSGNPFSGVTVNVLKDSNVAYSATTLSDGSFSINDIAEGDYVVSINVSGYYAYSGNITISPGAATPLSITLTKKPPVETPDENIPGDVNGDNLVNLQDLVFVANYYGNYDPSNAGSLKADVNNDGKVDITDLIFVNRRMTN